VAGQLLSANQRFGPLDPMVVASASEAHRRGASLGLVRPRNTKFRFRRKPEAALQAEQEAYRNAGRQQSFLDEELTAFKPSTYEFVFAFEDADGRHAWRCGDWETHATFFKWRREYGELEALQRLAGKYNDEYPQRGVAFAVGNMAKRPQTWQLLGVIRLDETGQLNLL